MVLSSGQLSEEQLPLLLKTVTGKKRFAVYSAFYYVAGMRQVVWAFKQGFDKEILDYLAHNMAQMLVAWIVMQPPGRYSLVPSPSGLFRRLRGAAVVEEIARQMVSIIKAPIAYAAGGQILEYLPLLQKRISITNSYHQNIVQRRKVRQGRIFAKKMIDPATRIILLDDVLASGSTILDCERAILAAGGKVNIALVLATRV